METHQSWFRNALLQAMAPYRIFLSDDTTKSSHTTQKRPNSEEITHRPDGPVRNVRVILVLLVLITASITAISLFDPLAFLGSPHIAPGRTFDWAPVATGLVLAIEAALVFALTIEGGRRRRAEMLLRESEDRMATAAESANMGLWRWNIDRDNIWLTPHGRDMLGIPRDEELTMPLLERNVHPSDTNILHIAIEMALATREGDKDVFEVEYRLLIGGDRVHWVKTRGRARRGEDGRIVEIAGTIIDITDSKNMRAEAEKQRLTLAHLARISVLGELSGALAHELKQPLTAIMSNAQAAQRLLDHEPIDLKELRSAILDIVDDDTRAGNVITHLRALLKNDEKHHDLIDLNVVVLTALDLAQGDLTARQINVVKNLSDKKMLVIGDSVQLQQLVLNLILNAADAMSGTVEAGGMLLIATDLSSGKSVHLSVSDTGIGIKPEIMAKIFDPLITTKPQGLGLGLSICRAVTEAHGGSIWAVNNPGRGATFHTLFPVANGGEG